MEPILLIDANRGIYIPQVFAQHYARHLQNLEQLQEDINILLEGPENKEYWEAWEEVEREGIINIDGEACYLFESGDLWAIPQDFDIDKFIL